MEIFRKKFIIFSDNFTPTIGVLSQSHNETHSYIAASYIKYLESAGARVIPVPTNRDENFYEKVFQNINGVLLPGGGVDLVKSDYAKLSRYFLMKSVTENAVGHYFPIWGTCLGFEELLGENTLIVKIFNTSNLNLNIKLF